MAYGVRLFDSNGVEMVDRFVPTFIVDYIISPASGSRTYTPIRGKKLAAYALGYLGQTDFFKVPPASVSVSGNTVNWSGVSNKIPLLVVYE